jgi:hypothetical protein
VTDRPIISRSCPECRAVYEVTAVKVIIGDKAIMNAAAVM